MRKTESRRGKPDGFRAKLIPLPCPVTGFPPCGGEGGARTDCGIPGAGPFTYGVQTPSASVPEGYLPGDGYGTGRLWIVTRGDPRRAIPDDVPKVVQRIEPRISKKVSPTEDRHSGELTPGLQGHPIRAGLTISGRIFGVAGRGMPRPSPCSVEPGGSSASARSIAIRAGRPHNHRSTSPSTEDRSP